MRPWLILAAVAGLVLLAFALRSLEAAFVFPADGRVLLMPNDAAYHTRRALYSLANFPSVLFFDPYLAHPRGAFVPIPPLYDWGLAAVTWAVGGSERVLERVAAWSSPVLGALTVPVVFWIGRRLAGTTAGLLAAGILALLPIHVGFSLIGNADHHTAVALIAAAWLAVTVHALSSEPSRAIPWRAVIVHALVIAAMLLTWSGSLLLLALAEGTWFGLAGVGAGRRDLLRRQALACGLAAAGVAPYVFAQGFPTAGAFTSTTLSWLHPVVLLCLAGLCAGLGLVESARPSRGASGRAVRVAVMGGALAAVSFVLLPIGEGLTPGISFTMGAGAWAEVSAEQRALWPLIAGHERPALRTPLRFYGAFAYFVPLAALGVIPLLRDERRCHAAAALGIWSLCLGLLATMQLRFGNEFAVPGSIAFAIAIVTGMRAVARRMRRGPWTVALLSAAATLLLLAPALRAVHLPKIAAAVRAGSWPSAEPGRIALRHPNAFFAFLEEVRERTPETEGYLDRGRPCYGILTPPTLGHATVYKARRATPAGNMGPAIGPAQFDAVERFFAAAREAEALEIAERLAVRYVITSPVGRTAATPFGSRLQRGNASAHDGMPHLTRFRLLAVGPPRASYKLFEIVPGAILLARGRPGESVEVHLRMWAPGERVIDFLAQGQADGKGEARVRVPYATGPNGSLQVLEPHVISLGHAQLVARVSEADVLEGRTVEAVTASGPAAGPIFPSPST